MRRGNQLEVLEVIRTRDGHWICPICGEPYDHYGLARECLEECRGAHSHV